MQETVNINQGLFALKRCISALNHNKKARIAREQAAAAGIAAADLDAAGAAFFNDTATTDIYTRGDACY
eukprot:SAG22_NODE_8912_length_621_cov_1.605364_1_plen_68_part_10